jgi:ribose 5-phosphate isomerase A
VLYNAYVGEISWGFDGADQVTPERCAIKGKGGALLQEKILAKRCREYTIIVDSSKLVERLGVGCPVPVEVVPQAVSLVEGGLIKLGAKEVTLRSGSGKHGPVITEAGNVLLDVVFSEIDCDLERRIKQITGVVESGLFCGYISEVLVANPQGEVRSIVG